jgi:hypothetical protein
LPFAACATPFVIPVAYAPPVHAMTSATIDTAIDGVSLTLM